MDHLSGQQIQGYELKERIGSGGFGAVYKAYQSSIGREVALKIILPHFANQPEFIRRFEAEAQVIARLEHLHITPLYDYWRDPNGAYLVMRWLRGGSLRDTLQSSAYSVDMAARVVEQISSALAVAHTNGIIHRDLKPGNILLAEDGNAYLADFGIAKDLNLIHGTTEIDAIVGSPDYLSPEQARSEPVTPQTDVYSFGVVLYEMLTGQHPFPNLSPVERLYKHLSDALPLIEDLDLPLREGLNDVIQKATAKNPAHRYATTLAFAEAFRQIATLSSRDTPASLVEVLTQREQEILHLIIEGRSNKEIAEKIYVTVATVKWYITQIYRKLGVRSRVQAIVRARELNLITPNSSTPLSSLSNQMIQTDHFQPNNPYKGLRAFQSADAHDFFGREALIEKLIHRLRETEDFSRFLAVIGPSGSGKSSLVKAGLIPALWRGGLAESEKWFVIEILPGSRPLDELEVALTRVAGKQAGNLHEQLERDRFGLLRAAALILPDDGSELVLVIDQFEEVFTLIDDEKVRIHFLSLLQTAVTESRSRVRVIVTLRADFYDRPLRYAEFGELIRARMETILPLSTKSLEKAIAAPAEQVGVHFEEGLVATIIAETHYQTGALPLLQYALTELFEQRQGRTLTHAAYQQIGGTVGALARRTDHIYSELNATGQAIVRQMFMRLVTLGEGVEDTRRRVNRTELLTVASDADVMDEMIDTFAEYRLLSLNHDPATRQPTVEVAHEAILREWERLSNWIHLSREEIKTQQQLSHLTEEWLGAGKDASYLMSGLRLQQFEAWATQTELGLTPEERAYLNASVAQREQDTEAETQRQQREFKLEKRSQTVLRGLVGVLLLATVGAFGLTGIAANQNHQTQIALATSDANFQVAQRERARAENQSRISQSRELVGYANDTLSSDAELSALLALQAVNLTYTVEGTVLPEAENMLHQAVQELRRPLEIPLTPFDASIPLYLNYSPDSTKIIFPKNFGFNTGVADANTGELLYVVSGDLISVNVSSQNQIVTLMSKTNPPEIQLWDISSRERGQLVSTLPISLPELAGAVFDVISSVQYAIIATPELVRILDLTAHNQVMWPAARQLPPGYNRRMFSPDATQYAHQNVDGTVSVYDINTWENIMHLSPDGTSITTFTFSLDSKTIATANQNNTVTLWDAQSGTIRDTLFPSITPTWISLNEDGSRLAVSTNDGQVSIWDTVSQQKILTLSVSKINGLALSPDGTHLITVHHQGYIHIWDLVPSQEVLTVVSRDANSDTGPAGLDYSPDGQKFVTARVGKELIVWNANTGQQILTLSGHTARVLTTDWSPDGKLIASGGEDTTIKLWDANTGQNLRTLSGHTDRVYAVAFSPDSTRIASSSLDGTVRIWSVTTGELILTLDQPAAGRGVAWSPDGLRIAAATALVDKVDWLSHLRVWDALTGNLMWDKALANSQAGIVAFSPDGTQIAVGMLEAHAAYVFDSHTGKKLLTLSGHISNVPGVAYSPDGNQIATTGFNDDQRIIIWDAHTGQEHLTLYNPSTGVTRVTFSPDGHHLAALGMDGTTRIYVLPVADLIALAKSRLTRTLTAEECQRYLHTDTCPAG